jgi:hypothetical protein
MNNRHEFKTQKQKTLIIKTQCILGKEKYDIVEWEYPDKKILTIQRKKYINNDGAFNIDEWLNTIKAKRIELLKESDMMMLSDRVMFMTDDKVTEWVDYRQALRDLPDTIRALKPTGIIDINWPVKPE